MDLQFLPSALAEFKKLDGSIKKQFVKRLYALRDGTEVPMPVNRLSGYTTDCYKIKLKGAGYRLVYRWEVDRCLILVLTAGRRERNKVYEIARARLKKMEE